MSPLPSRRTPIRPADSATIVRDRRAELGRADEARAEQRQQDDSRNDPNASKWRYRPPQREDK